MESSASESAIKADGKTPVPTLKPSSTDVGSLSDDTQGHSLASKSLLFRLFESSVFNMDMAIQYFFEIEDEQIQAYLAKRLLGFRASEVDFYLLQLVSLYQKSSELAKHILPYFIHRCTESTEFAIHLVWLLDTFCPPHRDANNRSSTLNRPSSVPTFSQAARNLSLATLVQTTNSGQVGSIPTAGLAVGGLIPGDIDTLENQNFTARQLRTILLPSPEESQLFLAHHCGAPSENSSCSTTHAPNPCNPVVERPVPTDLLFKSSVDSFGPGHATQVDTISSHMSTKPPPSNPYLLSHKRAVSDVTTFDRFHPCISKSDPCHTSMNGSLHKPQGDQWSSEDSAVGLSREGEIFPEDSTADLVLDGVHSSVRQSFGSSSSRRSHDASSVQLSGLMKAGSVTSVNKMTPKEPPACAQFTTRLRGTRSLQRLCIPEVPGSARPQIFGVARNGSLDQISHSSVDSRVAPDSSGITTTDTTTTTSSSPLDSGLHLVISATEHSHNSAMADEARLTEAEPTRPTYHPVLTLQLRLFPRLVPEWEFIDGLSRLARRLVPISSKERRTAFLQAELANLNLHLPARVWIPVNKADHIVLRIPPTAAVCLNSKDKAPYLIYLEVLTCDDPWSVPLPTRPTSAGTRSQIRRSVDSINRASPNSLSNFPRLSPSLMVTPQGADALSLMSGYSEHSLEDICYSPEQAFCRSVHKDEKTDPKRNGVYPTVDSDVTITGSPKKAPVYIAAGDIRNRLKEQAEHEPHRSFKSDPEDPSAAVLKEPWAVKCQRIREHSPWGNLPGWRLTAAIIKVGDDLRQEQLAYQLLSVLQRIWREEHTPLWLRPLTVIVTSPDSGLIEPVPDTVSLHQIKRHARLSLRDYFLREHGPPNSEAFLTSQRNFVESCAAYCLVGYLLQVKDRHNGNILLDNEGHVIHIDYGFMLSASPGKNLGFETSPFKLTTEQVDVMGGVDSDMFKYYKSLLFRGLLAARKHMKEICVLVEIARATCPQLPCFARASGNVAVSGLRERFHMHHTDDQFMQRIDRMVEQSLHSMTTKLYDSFQYYTNGIQ
ncbi:Phosphatidylinositol 4-kinase [Fasciola hepatica]|uniref:Phosphatidylinositol 4-kinase beta n=1 Tax=Fasciola hepatica TaxID=6192 RepID=A0A4E0R9A5_FASHE|nr:Phosphatidylinositol 4-kinase [Fasciola hepatica]